MKSFDVLHRDQNVLQSYILEASAGTGKTFAIENIVTRLLVEKFDELPLMLDNILIVTFTKASTNDLKIRIRNNIERSILKIKHCLKYPEKIVDLPDYLAHWVEIDNAHEAKRTLEEALYGFNQAQIFTIHSFCWHLLKTNPVEGGIITSSNDSEQSVKSSTLIQLIKDFLRSSIVSKELLSDEQMNLLLSQHYSVEGLIQELLKYVRQGTPIIECKSHQELFHNWVAEMQRLKKYTSRDVIDEFHRQVPYYSGICDRKGLVKLEILEKIDRFSLLFDNVIWGPLDFEMLIRDGLIFTEIFSEEKKNKKAKTGIDDSLLCLELKPMKNIVDEARSPSHIFCRIAKACQNYVSQKLKEQGLFRFDDLLSETLQALKNPSFAQVIRNTYKAAIIDEFQDTDPIQWEIFKTLFLHDDWRGFLYLVGDPKQSIYAFRQADVYTYLEAKKHFKNDQSGTLDTNFRSVPSLLQSLNYLFTSAKDWIPLPAISETLEYRPVKAGIAQSTVPVESLKFFATRKREMKFRNFPLHQFEKEDFFPYIGNEIVNLQTVHQYSYDQMAILVGDRYQAARLSSYLDQLKIPSISQKPRSLADSSVIREMEELLRGVIYYKNTSHVKAALTTRVIGWSQEHIGSFEQEEVAENITAQLSQLNQILLQEGFCNFYEQFMQTAWRENQKTVQMSILSEIDGLEFYEEWQQLAELLMEHQISCKATPEALLKFLDDCSSPNFKEDDQIKILKDRERPSVQILTIHASKGLEFDIVFALGLICRSKPPDLLVPIKEGHIQQISPALDKNDPLYLKHCFELEAEKSRQLYVALTRAKSRLYVPLILADDLPKPELGTASAIELFAQRFNEYPGSFEGFLQSHVEKGNWSIEYCSENPRLDSTEDLKELPELMAPASVSIPASQRSVYSFTSLSKDALTEIKTPSFLNFEFATEKSPHTLPPGNETGTILHSILEKLPLPVPCLPSELAPYVTPFVKNTQLQEWAIPICTMIHNALHMPLFPQEFRLTDVNPKHILRETEFLFPQKSDYVKGIMDMVFMHRDKYYIIDWKSNWLGPTCAEYTRDRLYSTMEQHQYFLQASLYAKALERYMKIFHSKPFLDIFGGIYYVFLRGLDPKTGNGIFYWSLKEHTRMTNDFFRN